MAKVAGGKGSGKTPGAVLQKKISDLGVAVSTVSGALGQNAQTFKKILTDKKRIDIELALQFAKLFGDTPDFWIDLQRKAGLDEAKKNTKLQKKLKELKKLQKVEKGARGAKKVAAKKVGKKPVKKAAAKKPVAKKATRKPRAASQSSSSPSYSGSDSSF
ncbi:hypothetical protein FACS1894190_03060 [Spirochaetia bacterium]|nr:hypothetical protein FACS1894190_03060 [Spirochaetia bacterium]